MGDKAILKLPATYPQDVGDYRCVLRNPAGETESSCRLDLSRRADRPLNIGELIDAASVPPVRRRPQSPLQDGWRSPLTSRRPLTPARPESLDRISPHQVYPPASTERRPSWRATSVPPQFTNVYMTEWVSLKISSACTYNHIYD